MGFETCQICGHLSTDEKEYAAHIREAHPEAVKTTVTKGRIFKHKVVVIPPSVERLSA